MNWFLITQAGIGICGLSSIVLVLVFANRPTWRRWAPVFGLAGQPFWFVSTLLAEQWMTFALTVAYTLTWAHDLRQQWKR